MLLVGVLLSGATGRATAATADLPPGVAVARTPPEFVSAVGRALPVVLRGADTLDARRDRLTPYLGSVVDLEAVGRFCLGRFWSQATTAERSRYLDLLLRSLADGVAMRVDVYGSGRTRVTTLPAVEVPGGTEVPTTVDDGRDAPINVTWLVEGRTPPFHLIDVSAQGLSLRIARRDDFNAFLTRHGGDMGAFLAALQAHAP